MKHKSTSLLTVLVLLLAMLVPCGVSGWARTDNAAVHYVNNTDDDDDPDVPDDEDGDGEDEDGDAESSDDTSGDEEETADDEEETADEDEETPEEGEEGDSEDETAEEEEYEDEEENDSILVAYLGVGFKLQKEMRERVLAAGGKIIKHVVQRGEDYETIAERYGIDYADIKVLNPFYDEACTGVTLEIPVMPVMTNTATAAASATATTTAPTTASKSLAAVTPAPSTPTPAPTTTPTTTSQSSAPAVPKVDSRYKTAKGYLDDKDYKKAIKTYSEIIDGGNPLLTAYVGRGIAYYNREKYTHAVKDFSRAYNMVSSDDKELAADIRGLLDQAQSAKEARAERRGQMWGSIIATVAQGAVTYFAAKQQSEMQKSYANYMSGGYASSNVSRSTSSGSSRNLNYLLDPRYAIMQTNMQLEQEYQTMRAANPSLTRQEYMQLKGQAYAAVQQAERGGSSSGYTSSVTESNSNKVNVTSTSTRRCKKLSATDLAHCGGSGRCAHCNGNKKYYSTAFGNAHWVDPCETCGGTGKCPSCGGTGSRY